MKAHVLCINITAAELKIAILNIYEDGRLETLEIRLPKYGEGKYIPRYNLCFDVNFRFVLNKKEKRAENRERKM